MEPHLENENGVEEIVQPFPDALIEENGGEETRRVLVMAWADTE